MISNAWERNMSLVILSTSLFLLSETKTHLQLQTNPAEGFKIKLQNQVTYIGFNE